MTGDMELATKTFAGRHSKGKVRLGLVRFKARVRYLGLGLAAPFYMAALRNGGPESTVN